MPLVSKIAIAVFAISKAARTRAARHRVARPMQIERHTSSSILRLGCHVPAADRAVFRIENPDHALKWTMLASV